MSLTIIATLLSLDGAVNHLNTSSMLKLKLHCDSISEMFWFEAYLKFELRSWLSSVQLKLVIAETKPVFGEEV